MSDMYKSSPVDIALSKASGRMWAEAYGLDLEDEGVQKFIEHQAKVQACLYARIRWLENIYLNNQNKSPLDYKLHVE